MLSRSDDPDCFALDAKVYRLWCRCLTDGQSGKSYHASPSRGCSSVFGSAPTSACTETTAARGRTAVAGRRHSSDQCCCPSSTGSNGDSGSDRQGSQVWRCAGCEAAGKRNGCSTDYKIMHRRRNSSRGGGNREAGTGKATRLFHWPASRELFGEPCGRDISKTRRTS